LAVHRPQARIVSERSPQASDFGAGWQWFSVRGVDEVDRPARFAGAMPRFVQVVQHWQYETGLDAAATTPIGFSQGAITPWSPRNKRCLWPAA
jgi:phospholipase/carboxylesterase